MPYISGLNNKDGKVIVINEADWSVELSEDLEASPDEAYEKTVTSGSKLVAFRRTSGEIEAYGNVTPSETSISGSPEVPIVDNWTAVFDNTYWEPIAAGDAVWDHPSYPNTWTTDSESAQKQFRIFLKPKTGSTWAEGFRPTKIRITHTGHSAGPGDMFYVEDTQSEYIINTEFTNIESGVEFGMTFINDDIAALKCPAIDTLPGLYAYYEISNIEFNVDPTSAPFSDDFTNNDWWGETDVDGVGAFTAGGYVKSGAETTSPIELDGASKFEFAGLFDFEVEFDITSVTGLGNFWSTYIGLSLIENTGKAASWVNVSYNANGTFGESDYTGFFVRGNWQGTPTDWGTFGTGTYKIRLRRNANNSLTLWVWNNSQWEWNGNTAGMTSPTSDWESNVVLNLDMSDSDGSNYFLGKFVNVTLNEGTFVDLT